MHIKTKATSVRPALPIAHNNRVTTGAALNTNVIKTQTIKPIISNMAYSPIHYTDTQVADGVYL